jgi:hypothetical protein
MAARCEEQGDWAEQGAGRQHRSLHGFLDVDFDLGTEAITLAGINANVGKQGLPASQVELNISGSDKDIDTITVDLPTLVSQSSTLAMHDLLAGNDFFTGLFPGSFGVENFDSMAAAPCSSK